MKKWFVSAIVLLMSSLYCTSFAKGPDGSITQFYKNPSPERAYVQLSDAAEKVAKVKPEIKNRALQVSTLFVAGVLKLHPDYIDLCAKHFDTFSFYEKVILLRALIALGIQDARMKADEAVQKEIDSCEIPLFSDLERLQIKSDTEVSILFFSFFTSGDELYLKQILSFVNSDPEMLQFAYEWKQRRIFADIRSQETGIKQRPEWADLLAVIKGWPEEKRDLFWGVRFALDGLENLSKEDLDASDKIKKLMKENPSLDYLAVLKVAG